MKCSNCGKEIANDSLFCEFCGTRIMGTEKQRHGFVSFWLYLLCAVNVIMLVRYLWISDIVSMLFSFSWISHMLYFGVQMSVVVEYILTVIGACLLIYWKKAGFWLCCAADVLGIVPNIFYYHWNAYSSLVSFLVDEIVPVLSALILWVILQIKKDGISCWSQLV